MEEVGGEKGRNEGDVRLEIGDIVRERRLVK